MATKRDYDFDLMLDECHDEVCIGNLTFSPSEVLYCCDPVAYRIAVEEYYDSLEEDEEYEDCEEDGYDD